MQMSQLIARVKSCGSSQVIIYVIEIEQVKYYPMVPVGIRPLRGIVTVPPLFVLIPRWADVFYFLTFRAL